MKCKVISWCNTKYLRHKGYDLIKMKHRKNYYVAVVFL